MKQLRRLDDIDTSDPYRTLMRAPLRHAALPEKRFRELERDRPGLVAVEGRSVLAALPQPRRIDLVYGFPDHDAFARDFPAMLQRVLKEVKPDEAPLGVYLRFTDAPSRPYVEPVLIASAFELHREWIRMELVALPEDVPSNGEPSNVLAPGFALRPARAADADAIIELDAVAFPSSFVDSAMAREQVKKAAVLRMLEESKSGRAIGFLRLRIDGPGTGYVSDIAIHPDYHRRGLGEAAMRWALGWFRSQDLHRAALTVSGDNGPAIALYRKLGFVAEQTGLDYRRPIDEDEIRQVLDKHRAEHISVRKRV